MARNIVTEIRKATRRKFSAEEKIRIVLEGLRSEIPISELARREGIAPTVYYRWSKAFLEAGKNDLTKDTHRDATSEEVRQLKADNEAIKRALAEARVPVHINVLDSPATCSSFPGLPPTPKKQREPPITPLLEGLRQPTDSGRRRLNCPHPPFCDSGGGDSVWRWRPQE